MNFGSQVSDIYLRNRSIGFLTLDEICPALTCLVFRLKQRQIRKSLIFAEKKTSFGEHDKQMFDSCYFLRTLGDKQNISPAALSTQL